MPNTGVDVDPNAMATNASKPDPKKLFSLRLTGKDMYRIYGDKIQLPAMFASGDCLIQVRNSGEYTTSQKTALFQHIYAWPTLHNWANSLIDICFVRQTRRETTRDFLWVQIGTTHGYYDFLKLDTDVWVKRGQPRPEEQNRPRFSEWEKRRFSGFNVYTPTGQIHDTRWEIPWRRPL
jgi:hypothetical protein